MFKGIRYTYIELLRTEPRLSDETANSAKREHELIVEMLAKFLYKAGVISTKCVYMRVVVTFPYVGSTLCTVQCCNAGWY